ncbi:unnamed protein product [Polarella glacialis]|uniref:Uncharacterized protein n=2 Tax=Polarella glacialis TaxID=89957 RepID=A0A813FYJ0_POLGL|nr:unnamed protein product [Polarella glacialis]
MGSALSEGIASVSSMIEAGDTSACDSSCEAGDTSCQTFAFGGGQSVGHLGMRRSIGTEAASVCEMANLGLPIVPGFCITPELLPDGQFKELQSKLGRALSELEQTTAKQFGAQANPLLLTVRSSSMQAPAPGTSEVSNIGLNDAIAKTWSLSESPHLVWDSYRRLIVSYAASVKHLDMAPFELGLSRIKERLDGSCRLGRKHRDCDIPTKDLQELVASYKELYQQQAGEEFPQEPGAQLLEVVKSTLLVAGQQASASAVVQATASGNGSQSGAGRLFMSSAGMCGEWLPNAAVTGLEHGDFLTLQEEMPATYASLLHYQDILKNNLDDLHDVDFVVQQGIVWLLGVSSAKTLPGSTLPGLCSDQWASSEECASNDGLAVSMHQHTVEEVQQPEYLASCNVPVEIGSDSGAGGLPATAGASFTSVDPDGDATMTHDLWDGNLGRQDDVAQLTMNATKATFVRQARAKLPAGGLRQCVRHEGFTPSASFLPRTRRGRMKRLFAQKPQFLPGACPELPLPFWQTALAGGVAAVATGSIAANSMPRVPGAGRAFLTGAFCCTGYLKLLCLSSADGRPDEVSAPWRLGCAALAVAGATTLVTPLDLSQGASRTNLLASRRPVTSPLTAAGFAAALRSAAGHGRLSSKLAAAVPAMSIEMCTIDVVKNLGTGAGYEVSPGLLLVAGGVAGAVSTTVTHPLALSRCLAGAASCSFLGLPRQAGGIATTATTSSKPHNSGSQWSTLRQLGPAYMSRMAAVSANSLVRVGMVTYFLNSSGS